LDAKGKAGGNGKWSKGNSKGKGLGSSEHGCDHDHADDGWWQADGWQDEASWQHNAWQDGSWSAPGPTEQPEKEMGPLGAYDFASLDRVPRDLNMFGSASGKYPVSDGIREWIKISYDSGAAATAFPVELAGDIELKKRGEFVVGTERKISGSVTGVHKPLGSAAAMGAMHDDHLIWDNGGSMIPKWSPIAIGLRRYYAELCSKYGADGVLPPYREGNLYNFYLAKTAAPVQLIPMKANVEMAPRASESGNRRLAMKP